MRLQVITTVLHKGKALELGNTGQMELQGPRHSLEVHGLHPQAETRREDVARALGSTR